VRKPWIENGSTAHKVEEKKEEKRKEKVVEKNRQFV
jgi:hypothetical protein